MKKKMRTYSIVMATYNKAWALREVIDSITRQDTGGHCGEIIIVDDGSTDNTAELCLTELGEKIKYVRLNDAVGVSRNSAVARNVGYRMASGDVVIAQSDEVVHVELNTVQQLVDDLTEGSFLIGTVYDFGDGKRVGRFTGVNNQRPLFFLGSLFRRDLYKVGGNDEDFKRPGYEDAWFGECLTRGLGLKPVYHPGVIGHHLHHNQQQLNECKESEWIYKAKEAGGVFQSGGGQWLW